MKKEIVKTPYRLIAYFQDHKDDVTLSFEVENTFLESVGYKAFIDVAQIFKYKMLTPKTVDDAKVELHFLKLNLDKSFHKDMKSEEKYGLESAFFKIDKIMQPSFLYHYQEALKFCDVYSKNRILNLGINKGDEFEVIYELLGDDARNKELVGVDYSPSIIEYASQKFHDAKLVCGDINDLASLDLGRFDMIISIGTLQSSNINFNERFMSIYQNQLHNGGAIILGFPNCRWIDCEMVYGAMTPNYNFSEMSLVLKDIHFCKKYLQQKGYRVVITGKDYLFLSARKIGVV